MALLLAPPPARVLERIPAGRNSRRVRAALETPRLSVIIVNYRQWHETAKLVRQLRADPLVRDGAVEVIIVDNHSPASRLMHKLRRLPAVSLRRWNKNHGFARAVNEGCRLSRGDWFLLLNPDIELTPGFLRGAFDLAETLSQREPRAGVLGFRLRNGDGSRQLSTGRFPTLLGTLARLLLPRRRRKYQAVPAETRSRVPWVTGCCLLVRRQCLEELGGLDEEFFLYYEDVDLCRRAAACGWSTWFEPKLTAVHYHPLHLRRVPAVLRLVTRHSLLTYGRKHWPGWQFNVLARIIRAEAWARRVWARLRGDPVQAGVFLEMGNVVEDLVKGEVEGARRRLRAAVKDIDVRAGA